MSQQLKTTKKYDVTCVSCWYTKVYREDEVIPAFCFKCGSDRIIKGER